MKISDKKYSFGGIGVLERTIEKGVGDNSYKSILDDAEHFQGDDSSSIEDFNKMIQYDIPEKTGLSENNLMGFLELNGIDKRSITNDLKFKSL